MSSKASEKQGGNLAPGGPWGYREHSLRITTLPFSNPQEAYGSER